MKWLVLICFVLLAQIGCASSITQSPELPAKDILVPEAILRINGSGDPTVGISSRTAPSFHISKNEWYIETTCSALDPAIQVFFSVAVYPKGELITDDNLVGMALQSSPGTVTNYVHKAGDFYLVITAINVQEWTVKIYQ